jgi:Delta7-sterol 5-desaturase
MNHLVGYCQLFVFMFGMFLAVYFILSGTSYWVLYVAKKNQFKSRKIQARYPSRKIVYREIKWSVISVLLMSFLNTILVICISKGFTKMYFDIREFGWVYLFGSIVLCVFINDTHFYWMHRFMHLKMVFPWVHKIHHLSHSPTPWSIFSFSPVESFVHYSIFPLMIFFIALHPVAVAILVTYNILMNLGGHLGYEIIPLKFHTHWLLKYSNTVTHHEMHHAKVKCNYGLYFNIWDHLMKTNHADYERKFLEVHEQINRSVSADQEMISKSAIGQSLKRIETNRNQITFQNIRNDDSYFN